MATNMPLPALITAAALMLLQASSAIAQPAGPFPAGAPGAGSMGPGGARPLRDAKENEIRVIATGSIDAPLRPMQAEAEAAVKAPLIMEFGGARGGLRDEILAGQDFEVAVLLPDVNQEIIKLGKALPKTYAIASVPVGIGYRGEGPLPDVSTAAALKKLLLGAKSVSYNPTGAGQPTATKMLTSLGIADAVKDATKSAGSRGGMAFPAAGAGGPPGGAGGPPGGAGGPPGGAGGPPGGAAGPPGGFGGAPGGPGGPGGRSSAPLAPGEYELMISPLSEIVSNRSLRSLGPVIPEFQVPVIIEAVIGAHAKNEQAAKAFIEFLKSPAFEAALIKNSLVKAQ